MSSGVLASIYDDNSTTTCDTPNSGPFQYPDVILGLKIEEILAECTEPNQGAMFATAHIDGQSPLQTSDIKVWNHGAIMKSNSLRIGSLSKIFAMYNALKNGLSLSDRPSEFGLDPVDYVYADKITLNDLARHQAGLQPYTAYSMSNGSWLEGTFTAKRNVKLGWKNKELIFLPGTMYGYDNTGFEVISLMTQNKTGHNVRKILRDQFKTVAPSLTYDNGQTPIGDWPSAAGYSNWPIPPTLPDAAGSAIGVVYDVVKAFSKVIQDAPIFSIMSDFLYPSLPPNIPSADVVATRVIGRGLLRYDNTVLGSVIGHDGTLVTRSIIVFHPQSSRVFFFHYSFDMTNDKLLHVLNQLMILFK